MPPDAVDVEELDRFGELALEMRLSTGDATAASREPNGDEFLAFLPPGLRDDSSSSYVNETVLATVIGRDWAEAEAVCVSIVDSEQLELWADLRPGDVGDVRPGRGIMLGHGTRQLGSSMFDSDRVTSSGRWISWNNELLHLQL